MPGISFWGIRFGRITGVGPLPGNNVKSGALQIAQSANPRDDPSLVRAVLDGDREAYAELVARHQDAVVALLCSRLRDRRAVDDLAQDTLVEAYTHLRSLKDPSRFRSWLAGIAFNVANGWLKKQGSELRALDRVAQQMGDTSQDVPTPWDDLEQQQVAERVWAAVDELPERTREAVLLHYVSGLSDQEIASTLGLSASAVRSRLHYGRQKLRDHMLPVAADVFARKRRTRRFTKAVMAALPLALPRPAAAATFFGLTIKELLMSVTGVAIIAGLLGVIWTRQESAATEIVDSAPRVVRLASAEQMLALQTSITDDVADSPTGGKSMHLDLEAERLFPGSLTGCLRPALRTVGLDWSPDFIPGYLGSAFAFAMRPDGDRLEQADAWDWHNFWEMLNYLEFDMISATLHGNDPQTPEEHDQAKVEAWDLVRKAIDDGRPAISWQMASKDDKPETFPWLWSLIVGYDEAAGTYTAHHRQAGTFTIAYDGYGHTDPANWFTVMVAKPLSKPFDVVGANRRAIERAIESSQGKYPGVPTGKGHEDTYPHGTASAHGLAAWEMWLGAFQDGTVSVSAIGSHAGFLVNARSAAAGYLAEVAPLYPGAAGDHLMEAADWYDEVTDAMLDLGRAVGGPADLPKGAEILAKGLEAERTALEHLQKALDAM